MGIAAAACFCIAIVAATLLRQAPNESTDSFVVKVSHDAEEQIAYNLSYAEISEGMNLSTESPDGQSVQTAYIISEAGEDSESGSMTQEEVEYYAYMDYDTAPDELKETILAARNQIIYSMSWASDGYECSIINSDGTTTKLPAFSELFPGCEIPTSEISEDDFTADGLSKNELFGTYVEIQET